MKVLRDLEKKKKKTPEKYTTNNFLSNAVKLVIVRQLSFICSMKFAYVRIFLKTIFYNSFSAKWSKLPEDSTRMGFSGTHSE